MGISRLTQGVALRWLRPSECRVALLHAPKLPAEVVLPGRGQVRSFWWAKGPSTTASRDGEGGSGDGSGGSNSSDGGGAPTGGGGQQGGGGGSGGGGGRGRGKRARAAEQSDAATELIVAPRTEPERTPIGENAPRPPHVLAVPLARRPLFPGFMAPLVIQDEALIEALVTVKRTPAPYVGLFMLKDPEIDLTVEKFSLRSVDQIYKVGVLAHIQQLEAGPSGAIAMMMAHRRIELVDSVTTSPPLIVKVNHLVQEPLERVNTDEVKATCNEILATLREIIRVNPLFQQHIAYFARKIDVTNPYSLADFAASLTTLDAKELQAVLETMNLEDRLKKALLLLKKEQQLSTLQQTIKQDVEKRIDKQQRNYFLQEQLKSIKKELGVEKDDKEALVAKFNERIAKLQLPPTAKQVYDEEIEKLQVLERNSSEFNVTRSYLDWLTSLPWSKYSQDNFDLAAARKILDEDHYGMNDVKDRILEFIAVGKLKGTVQGKIICLVGPPGVGKTSIGKSVARSLNRQFYRFSVGGLNDVAEIKGHRRTYIGAMPGKLIQCLKSTGVSNPLVLIDEIDKIGHGRGYSGDPSSALLEMLDPNQNGSFMDHYLDTPVDASKVLFICTANTLDTIPGPLLDRMEIIRLSGYDAPEKMQIARRYLDPKIREEMGLQQSTPTTPKSLQLTDGALEQLIRWYARESGVRNLEKLLSKTYRKAAMQIVAAREALAAKQEPQLNAEKAPDSAYESPSGSAAAAPTTATGGAAGTPDSQPASTTTTANGTPTAPTTGSASGTQQEGSDVLAVEDPKWTITADNLEDYVGKPQFLADRLYDIPPAGVVMGLAWTAMGGSALYIEVMSPYPRLARGGGAKGFLPGPATAVGDQNSPTTITNNDDAGGGADEGDNDQHGEKRPTKPSVVSDGGDARSGLPSGGSLRITGKLGDVMQESAQIAYTVARRRLRDIPGQAANDYLDVTPLHMHVPEGATPKDGPSAGVTMVTALLSVAMNKPVRPDLGMTGEITLTGKVLPVGGIKEKTMAARRAGVKCLVFPLPNKRDFDELPLHLKEGLEVHFASDYNDVFKVAFDYDDSVVRETETRARDPTSHPASVPVEEKEELRGRAA